MLSVGIPTLGVRLSELDHELIAEAQRLPEVHAASGADRVLSLSDRLWFKVKTGRWRGAATLLPAKDHALLDGPPVHPARWWLGAGGFRRDGDPADFYASLEATAKREAKGSAATVCSDRWLPRKWDWERLQLEHAVAWEYQVRTVMGALIAQSLRTGRIYQADLMHYSVKAMARAFDGETYLIVGFDRLADPRVLAVILASVPGIEKDSWMVEPGGVVGIEPEPGEIVWSSILPPGVAAELLDAFPETGR
jgi:hypothetical protein